MDLALEATNQHGRYQIYLIIIVIFLPFTTVILTAGYPYLTSTPKIWCQNKNTITSDIYTECTMSYYCSNKENINMIIDPNDNIDSFSIKYSLWCEKAYLSPWLNSSFFLGAILGVVVCANYPDNIGRLPVLKVLMWWNIFSQINYFFSLSFFHLLTIAFIAGFTTYCNSVWSLLIVETMDSSWASWVMSARSASYGWVGVTLAFYFMSFNNLRLLWFINICIATASFLLVQRNFVESPRWLNSKNRLMEAIECLKQISIINNSQEHFNTFLDVNKEMLQSSHKEIEEIKHTYNIIQILQLKSQTKLIRSMIFIWFSITLCFYGIFSSLNKGSGNVFTKSIISYGAEVIAEMGSGVLANKFGRVIVMETLSSVAGIAFVLLYFIPQELYFIKSWIIFICSFGFSGTMNLLYIYTNEIFPWSIKALSFGLMFWVSRIGGVTVPVFWSTDYYPVVLGGLAVASGYLIGKLEETWGRKWQDDVPEALRSYSILSTVQVDRENIEFVKQSFKMGKDPFNISSRFLLSFTTQQGNLSTKW